MLLSRCLVVNDGSYCKYSLLRTSLATVHACSQCFVQENLDFLEDYAPLRIAQVRMHLDAESRQACILLSGGFEEIHGQHHIFLKDSIVRSIGEDHYSS